MATEPIPVEDIEPTLTVTENEGITAMRDPEEDDAWLASDTLARDLEVASA